MHSPSLPLRAGDPREMWKNGRRRCGLRCRPAREDVCSRATQLPQKHAQLKSPISIHKLAQRQKARALAARMTAHGQHAVRQLSHAGLQHFFPGSRLAHRSTANVAQDLGRSRAHPVAGTDARSTARYIECYTGGMAAIRMATNVVVSGQVAPHVRAPGVSRGGSQQCAKSGHLVVHPWRLHGLRAA
jgi:hypothetical protein